MNHPAISDKWHIAMLIAIPLLSPQISTGQTLTSPDRPPTAETPQAAAVPLKVHLLMASDYSATDLQRRLLDVPELAVESLVMVPNLAEADMAIQIDRNPSWPDAGSPRFRLWSVPGEKLLATKIVRESDEAKPCTRLVQEVAKEIKKIRENPKSAFNPRVPPTPAEVQEYVQRARQRLAQDLKIPEEQVRVAGGPILAPILDHARWSPPPFNSEEWLLSLNTGKVLVNLDAGLGNRICGHHRVLVSDDGVKILDLVDEGRFERALPITDEECRRVTEELDRFYEAAVQVERGPDRFLPFLAKKVVTDLGHTEGEHNAPMKSKRQWLALYLDFRTLATLMSFEGLPMPDTKGLSEDETADPSEALKPWLDNLRDTLSKSGPLQPSHLAAIRPYLQQLAAWGPVHKCPFNDNEVLGAEDLDMPTEGTSYNMIMDPIYYCWIWESGRLKLFAAFCGE